MSDVRFLHGWLLQQQNLQIKCENLKKYSVNDKPFILFRMDVNKNKDELGPGIFSTTEEEELEKMARSPKMCDCENCKTAALAFKVEDMMIPDEGPSKGFECPTCHLILDTQKILRRHQKIHSAERAYPCHYLFGPDEPCKEAFTRKGTIHLRRQHVLGGEGCPHLPMVERSQYIRIKTPLHK